MKMKTMRKVKMKLKKTQKKNGTIVGRRPQLRQAIKSPIQSTAFQMQPMHMHSSCVLKQRTTAMKKKSRNPSVCPTLPSPSSLPPSASQSPPLSRALLLFPAQARASLPLPLLPSRWPLLLQVLPTQTLPLLLVLLSMTSHKLWLESPHLINHWLSRNSFCA